MNSIASTPDPNALVAGQGAGTEAKLSYSRKVMTPKTS
jgi:hypothetical protein